MISEKDFLDICKLNGLKAFKVTTELDDTDILLDTDDINVFLEVCRCYSITCVYYSYVEQMREAYEINKDQLMEHIEDFISSNEIRIRYNPFGFNDDAIELDSLLEKYECKIDEIIDRQSHLIEKCEWGTPLALEVFIPHYGDRIGISIFNDSLNVQSELKWYSKLIEDLDEELEKEIAFLYSENNRIKAEQHEKEIQEREKRHDNAIIEIKALLQSSERLMKCTNSKLRHAYARDLADDYSEKYCCYITIGEIDVLVDEEYKIRKKA